MSFLQWAGGKAKSISHIGKCLPSEVRNYYEPFLGGGSVLLHVLQQADEGRMQLQGQVVVGDINEPLITCFQAIKSDGEGVVDAFERLCAAYEACPNASSCKKHYCVCGCQECMYYAVRTMFNIYKATPIVPETELAAQFLFLNATCYRGLYRESKAGAFNTCFWTSRPLFPKSDKIVAASRLFQKYDVTFQHCSYKDFWERHLGGLGRGDLLYIDPPFIKGAVDDVKHFGTSDATWLYSWLAGNNDACVVLSTSASVMEEHFSTWPVAALFSSHRSLMYKGATKMCECVVSNLAPAKNDIKENEANE